MMIIRKATINDVDTIVEIHLNAFEGFFLTSLGAEFLRFYYSCFVRSNETVTMIAEENGVIYGFSASSKFCKGFNSRLIKSNLIAFGLLSFKLLLIKPISLLRLVKNLSKKGENVIDNEDYAELYSIGVCKSAQGKGVGKMLLLKSEQVMKEEGVTRVSLTTDFDNNEQAVGFYHSMGYETFYEFITYPNRKMYRLIKTL
ncbi:MAG TPA: GNAT family N-acetyltransferase [Bacteroides sp.]|nr:GNAT family N-acetyltransferase [Bacteroides sp.]